MFSFFTSTAFSSFTKYFKLKKELGSGGFGQVYLVKRRKDEKLFAAKQIKKKWITQSVTLANSKQKPLPMEIWTLTGLSHPNIITLFTHFELKLHWIMVLDYDQNYDDLFNHISKRGALEESAAKKVFKQVHMAADYLFTVGIDHRDIKDENILIHSDTGNYNFQLSLIIVNKAES